VFLSRTGNSLSTSFSNDTSTDRRGLGASKRMADIVSKATRRAFQESYVSWTVLREIATDFEDAGVPLAELPPGTMVSGQRRSLVEGYYRSVDWFSPTQVRRVLDAFESHLLRLVDRGAQEEVSKLVRLLERDNIHYQNGKIIFSAPHTTLDELVDAHLAVDLSQLQVNISRIKNAVDQDPALAVGSSKELVEATCKAILVERKIAYPSNADVPDLVRLVAEELNLVAANVSKSVRGARSIRKVLGSLANTVQGLAELRNLYGSGHGRSPGQKGLSPRHARLCAGAASVLSLFLMETAKERGTP